MKIFDVKLKLSRGGNYAIEDICNCCGASTVKYYIKLCDAIKYRDKLINKYKLKYKDEPCILRIYDFDTLCREIYIGIYVIPKNIVKIGLNKKVTELLLTLDKEK